MSDTILTPDPASGDDRTIPQPGTLKPPTSWIEQGKAPLPAEPVAPTIMAPSSVEEFPLEVRPHALDPNRQINQYILVKVLGKGGMGEVWKAWDRKLSRWAAIKFLLGESVDGVARFKREAKMAARLSHPNIAPVHEVGEAPSRQPGQPVTHFLAMEYIDGTTLGGAKLSLRDRVDVFVKVAQGVEAAHRGGVVHRDIKPANIMLTKENWPYVMDFGLAKSLDGDNNLSATGAVMGTPAFMPPEQVEGNLDQIGPRSDVYSLGATMYAVFCGVHPFTAQTTLQLLQKVCSEAPPAPRQKNPEISPELEAIILKTMEKKSEDRYATAGAVADALKKVLVRLDAAADGVPAPAPTVPVPAPAPVRKSSSGGLVAAAAVFLILAPAAGAAVWWFKFRKAPEAVASAAESKPAKVEPAVVPPVIDKRTEPIPEVKTEPKPETRTEAPVAKKEPVVAPEVKPELKPESKPEPKPEPKPEVKSEPKPEPKPEVKADPKPVVPVTPGAEQVMQRGYDWLAGRYKQAELAADSDYWAAYALQFAQTPVTRLRLMEFLKSGAWQQSSRAGVTASLRSLALAQTNDPRLQEMTAECAQFLVETQGPNGLWAESVAATVRLDEPKPAGDALIVSGDPARKRILIARQGTATRAPDGDLRTTALAVLGLYAAENCGHRVPAGTWKAALAGVEAQWDRDPSSAAVAAAVCRLSLGEADAANNPRILSVARALAAADSSAERLGGLFATPRLGDQEWYGAGAKALAALQQPDGSWTDGKDPVAATSQALLFLSRSTTSLKAAAKRGGTGRLEMKSIGGCSNLMFVLDASGRMRGDLGDRERFDVAKETIAKIAEKLPQGSILGLRVFGSRFLAVEPESENDSVLITPPGPVNARQIATHMQAIKVKGRTPLTFSLIQTGEDLMRVPRDVEMAVVLMIDGTDMARRADPVPATGDLAASRAGMKVHVVGFNAEDDEIQERLQKMADAGGGRYIKARNAKDILAQLTAATVGEQDYSVLDEKGEAYFSGRLGEARELPEGRYTVICGGQREVVWVNPGQTTRIIVNQLKLAK